MSSFVRLLVAAALAVPVALTSAVLGPAQAQDTDTLLGAPPAAGTAPPSSDRAVRSALPPGAGSAEADFAALSAAKTAAEAHGPERRILRAFNVSGSDTVDLLMTWADAAIGKKDLAGALDVLDQVVILKPDFAEGYNRRATVYYLLDDYTKSMADIRATLQRQPRHFGALTGLAAILKEIGETDRAIDILEQVAKIHPTLESARTELDKLRADKAGREI